MKELVRSGALFWMLFTFTFTIFPSVIIFIMVNRGVSTGNSSGKLMGMVNGCIFLVLGIVVLSLLLWDYLGIRKDLKKGVLLIKLSGQELVLTVISDLEEKF